MTTSDDVAALTARVIELEAERGVLAALTRYAHAIDYGDESAWVDTFTPDGVFEVHSRFSDQVTTYAGHEQLALYAAQHSRPPALWHKHLVVEPIVSVTGATSRCLSYVVAFIDSDGTAAVKLFGRYRDRLSRGADGVWRFSHRLGEIEAVSPNMPMLPFTRPYKPWVTPPAPTASASRVGLPAFDWVDAGDGT
ncbi:nuclear transport factor 2 family protein [Pedococcus sp. P5_B7]